MDERTTTNEVSQAPASGAAPLASAGAPQGAALAPGEPSEDPSTPAAEPEWASARRGEGADGDSAAPNAEAGPAASAEQGPQEDGADRERQASVAAPAAADPVLAARAALGALIARTPGSTWGLLAAGVASFGLMAAALIDPREPPTRAPIPPAAETLAEEAPASAPPMADVTAPLIESAEESDAASITVEAFSPARPLTVWETQTLRAVPGDEEADARGRVRPGQRLRVIGLAYVGDDEIWLQIRTDDGGVAYLAAKDATEMSSYRNHRAQVRAAEAAAVAAAAPVDPAAPVGAPLVIGPAPPQSTAPTQPGELY